VHGAVFEAELMHLRAYFAADDLITVVHHVEDFIRFLSLIHLRLGSRGAMQKICQLDKLFQRHFFRANLRGQLQFFRMPPQFVSGPILFQDFNIILRRWEPSSPPAQRAMQRGGKQRLFAPDQDDARGIDVRHREKTVGGDLEMTQRFVAQLQQKRKHTVIIITGGGDDAPRDFQLQGRDQPSRTSGSPAPVPRESARRRSRADWPPASNRSNRAVHGADSPRPIIMEEREVC